MPIQLPSYRFFSPWFPNLSWSQSQNLTYCYSLHPNPCKSKPNSVTLFYQIHVLWSNCCCHSSNRLVCNISFLQCFIEFQTNCESCGQLIYTNKDACKCRLQLLNIPQLSIYTLEINFVLNAPVVTVMGLPCKIICPVHDVCLQPFSLRYSIVGKEKSVGPIVTSLLPVERFLRKKWREPVTVHGSKWWRSKIKCMLDPKGGRSRGMDGVTQLPSLLRHSGQIELCTASPCITKMF